MTEELLPEWAAIQNCIFLFFLACLFIDVWVITTYKNPIILLYHDLFKKDERKGIFADTTGHRFFGKFLLSLQTVIIFAIVIYCIAIRPADPVEETVYQTISDLLLIIVLLGLFIIAKFILNALFGSIFFDKESLGLWSDTFFSLLSSGGFILFFPALFMFYIKDVYLFCLFFIVIYSIIAVFLTIYKISTTFFHRKIFSLYFILYLCGLEIIPLFLISKVFMLLFSTQKDTLILWLQI
ncbi:MAG: DUF4271 domain-containing protein [Dysgonamonadaceae bacterium]|jgi:hypothetical protein|nr:DUF4271 domain-containing protein [Dysgonamonadaceae bacterium]